MNISPVSSTPSNSPHKCSRTAILFAVLLLFLVSGLILSLSLGSTDLSLGEALRAVLAGNAESTAYRIFCYVRLPRTLAALITGAALATAGVILQAVLGNPMAAPNIIGVNAGAGLAAVWLIALFPAAASWLPLFSFVGALSACLIIWLIAALTGASRISITLVGVAISTILTAGINTAKTLYPDSILDANSFLVGGLSGVTPSRVLPAALLILAGLFCTLLCSARIDLLSIGEESAAALGIRVPLTRLMLLGLSALLAGTAVSVAGLLGFVGLLVPHILRRLTGTLHRRLLPAAMLGGAALVLWCDLLSRLIFSPLELPVGIPLSLIGGPFFIFLLLKGKGGATRA